MAGPRMKTLEPAFLAARPAQSTNRIEYCLKLTDCADTHVDKLVANSANHRRRAVAHDSSRGNAPIRRNRHHEKNRKIVEHVQARLPEAGGLETRSR